MDDDHGGLQIAVQRSRQLSWATRHAGTWETTSRMSLTEPHSSERAERPQTQQSGCTASSQFVNSSMWIHFVVKFYPTVKLHHAIRSVKMANSTDPLLHEDQKASIGAAHIGPTARGTTMLRGLERRCVTRHTTNRIYHDTPTGVSHIYVHWIMQTD
jgi:hypothetical protein